MTVVFVICNDVFWLRWQWRKVMVH